MSIGPVLGGDSGARAASPGGVNAVQKFVVLLVDANDHAPVRGSDRLQKILYTASRAIDELAEQCRFEPSNHGPHSEAVGKELACLAGMGILSDDGGRIATTPDGMRLAKDLSGAVDEHTMSVICDHKEFFNDMTDREALGFVCAAHPEVAGRSAEYAKIRPDMEGILLTLIHKEKISSGCAAELIGKPREYILGLMKDWVLHTCTTRRLALRPLSVRTQRASAQVGTAAPPITRRVILGDACGSAIAEAPAAPPITRRIRSRAPVRTH